MMSKWTRFGWLALFALSAVSPAIAQRANFEQLALARGFDRTSVSGFTTGSYSLSSIGRRDRSGNPCFGYGDPNPDHLMLIENDLSSLTLVVRSGEDTTLVVQGPGRELRCGDDSQGSQDARISDTNWPAGTYKIWVGSVAQGQRVDYQLSAQEE